MAIGVSRDFIRILESGNFNLSPPLLRTLCNVTFSDPGWILYGDHQPPVVALTGTIGQRLRALRLDRGITIAQLSQDVFGVPKKSSVSYWENDLNTPLLSSLMTLAEYYGVSAVSFIP